MALTAKHRSVPWHPPLPFYEVPSQFETPCPGRTSFPKAASLERWAGLGNCRPTSTRTHKVAHKMHVQVTFSQSFFISNGKPGSRPKSFFQYHRLSRITLDEVMRWRTVSSLHDHTPFCRPPCQQLTTMIISASVRIPSTSRLDPTHPATNRSEICAVRPPFSRLTNTAYFRMTTLPIN